MSTQLLDDVINASHHTSYFTSYSYFLDLNILCHEDKILIRTRGNVGDFLPD